MTEVLVVGGGPAGAACAWRLARSGTPCTVLDRAVFPREKVCGGALSLRGSLALTGSGMLSEAELDGLTVAQHSGMSLWHGEELLRNWDGGEPAIRIVDRGPFDAFLLERAASVGAVVLQGARVAGVDPQARTVSLASGERVAWRVLVGADGAGSVVRRACLPRRPRRGTGIGLEVFVPAGDFSPAPAELQIRFGLLPYGYGWVFPGTEQVCVGAGVAGSAAPARDVRRALERLLGWCGLPAGRYRLRGAPIPSMSLDRSLGAGNVYLIGDAAGLCDQVSGEGMCHAVAGGLLVGRSVAEGWSRRRLRREARAGLTGVIRQSARIRHLLHHPLFEEEAMFRLRRDPVFTEAFWSVVSGASDYAGMIARILRGL